MNKVDKNTTYKLIIKSYITGESVLKSWNCFVRPISRYPQKLSKDKVKTELELNLEAHIDVDTGDTSTI